MQHFYGSGKLLLSGEYYVLDGALALAMPTRFGQILKVTYHASEHKVLHWKSYDNEGKLWFEAKFDTESFDCLDRFISQKSLTLQKILRMARRLASNFLKGREYVLVETYLEFPRLWGLGSSSTLIHNVAQWAEVNPYDLLFGTIGGSGYDVACAQAKGPILYQKSPAGPHQHTVAFDPPFKQHLYFVYLGKKQSSAAGIEHYRSLKHNKAALAEQLSHITQAFLQAQTLSEFDALIAKHEQLIAESLCLTRTKDLFFRDYWGEIKSLGAWGGDFVLATSQRSEQETRQYFAEKGFNVILTYTEMVKASEQDKTNAASEHNLTAVIC
ncbi:MAG: GYDIA family GHMP kinase [Cytophagales bacterium]|nr:GYDIA family GHMP kinase [Bernardetiaceae bacterium]MDW8203494.1 GYDIA family GHMP kinase [Cytophagales bacterium]